VDQKTTYFSGPTDLHAFEADVNEEGILFSFNNTGGYIDCRICGRDNRNSIHAVACEELLNALDAFYDDPMTQAYGANDVDELLVREHKKKHGCWGLGLQEP
jgi:L-ascorbate metabolism protein UlaG (beta-lactamase superfamily)